jgi:hypothetical protein
VTTETTVTPAAACTAASVQLAAATGAAACSARRRLTSVFAAALKGTASTVVLDAPLNVTVVLTEARATSATGTPADAANAARSETATPPASTDSSAPPTPGTAR